MNTQHIQIDVPLEFNQLIEIVRQLSPSEKTILKEVLQESGDNDENIISEEHKNIVRQRIEASKADPSRLLKWEEVKHKIKT
jgi:hypothetical protein